MFMWLHGAAVGSHAQDKVSQGGAIIHRHRSQRYGFKRDTHGHCSALLPELATKDRLSITIPCGLWGRLQIIR